MPKFNADDASLFDPIEVTIGGQAYTVTTVTPAVMKKVAKLFEAVEKTNDMGKMFALTSEQLHLFLDVPTETFENMDMRKLSATVKFIVDTMTSQSDVTSDEGKEQGNGAKE